jgi:hypothetical protein
MESLALLSPDTSFKTLFENDRYFGHFDGG